MPRLEIFGSSRMVKINAFVLIILLTLTSCLPSMDKSSLKFEAPETPSVTPIGSDEDQQVAFENLKTNILIPKCVQCHSKWSSEFQFQKFIIPGDPENSRLFDSVKTGRMPIGDKLPLTSAELEMVRSYIQNARPVPAPPVVVKFDELKTKVLAPKCIACHKKWENEAEFLKRHIVPGDAEKSRMYDSVKMGRMPKAAENEDGTPGTVVPLEKNEAELIRNYINSLSAQPSNN